MEPAGVFIHKSADLRGEQGRENQNCAAALLRLWISGCVKYRDQRERQGWTWENERYIGSLENLSRIFPRSSSRRPGTKYHVEILLHKEIE